METSYERNLEFITNTYDTNMTWKDLLHMCNGKFPFPVKDLPSFRSGVAILC